MLQPDEPDRGNPRAVREQSVIGNHFGRDTVPGRLHEQLKEQRSVL
jgi:hypothetical protein